MTEPDKNLGEAVKLRELDPDVGQKHVAVAMMYVFPRFIHGLIQPKAEHKMVEHGGERCLAIALQMDNPLTDFQLDCLRGKYSQFSTGYADWYFQQQDGFLYVGIPMRTILAVDERLVAQAMAEFGNYDADFQELVNERMAEAIVDALVADFGRRTVDMDLAALGEDENS